MVVMYNAGASNVTSAAIVDDSIVNADINSGAAIVRTKLADTVFTFAGGVATKNIADASTTQTIAHGLGRIPKRVQLSFNGSFGGSGYYNVSKGGFDGTNNYCVFGSLGGSDTGTSSTSYAIAIGNERLGSIAGQTGVVTVDATNITITWTKAGSPTGTLPFMWEAE